MVRPALTASSTVQASENFERTLSSSSASANICMNAGKPIDALRSFHERRLRQTFHDWQVGRRVSTFDPMATAIDWLDTASSLSIVDFHASEAEVE